MAARNDNNKTLSIVAAISYLFMIFTNYMANVLPLNGLYTADITDKLYPNMFTPAGWTFSIWGFIYFMLLVYVLYSLNIIKAIDSLSDPQILDGTAILFTISSVLNIAWLFAWHYNMMVLSEIFMVGLWIVLFMIVVNIKRNKLTRLQYIYLKLPFSIYFGWITVALVANTVVMLVSLNFGFFGIPEVDWVRYVAIIGAIFTSIIAIINMDLAFSFVPMWGYFGILMKHALPSGYNNQYETIITTLAITIVGLFLVMLLILGQKKFQAGAVRRRRMS
jgi:hypothetical protein